MAASSYMRDRQTTSKYHRRIDLLMFFVFTKIFVKKKRFFTKKSYYLHLIMLIKWKARDSSVIRAESKMSTKLSHSLFYTISIDEFRGR